MVQLAAQGVVAGSDRVQDLHERIIRPFPLPGLALLTRGVYRGIKATATLTAKAAEIFGRRFESATTETNPGSVKENSLSILNGVCGDYLHASGNALAIPMQLRIADPTAKRVVLFVHGLCMNDSQWAPDLVREINDLGFSPAFLRYNTGLGVRENGRLLTQQLQQFSDVSALVIVTHSMGGLVMRAALAKAEQVRRKPSWLSALRAVVYLGTPHAGAPLEQAGHWLENFLALTPYAAALAPIAQVRSRGIQDLRRGLPAPKQHIRRYHQFAIAASLSAAPKAQHGKRLRDAMSGGIGDGLVAIRSALAQDVLSPIDLPSANQRVLYGIGHLDLLRHAEVIKQLRQWLERPEFTMTYDQAPTETS